MSVSNAQRLVTKQDLKDFYDGILPYLGGSADAGFTPVGTIISVMGVTAPVNYLACNGQTVNIADYPELADYFYQQFGSKNKFGGNGTTTFGIPDLRGEFLRGTGTNSHSKQGDGSNVGSHQDATVHVYEINDSSSNNLVYDKVTNSSVSGPSNADYFLKASGSGGAKYYPFNVDTNNKNIQSAYTSRPTNTSVLYCIATKNIYMNPSLDYSTSEKVVGAWIDGATLYQRTFDCGAMPNNTLKTITTDLVGTSIDKIIKLEGISLGSNNITRPLPYVWTSDGGGTTFFHALVIDRDSTTGLLNIKIKTNIDRSSENAYVTIQYTKVTT